MCLAHKRPWRQFKAGSASFKPDCLERNKHRWAALWVCATEDYYRYGEARLGGLRADEQRLGSAGSREPEDQDPDLEQEPESQAAGQTRRALARSLVLKKGTIQPALG